MLGGVAAVLAYRQMTQRAYIRLPNNDASDGYEYDNIHRVSTTEHLRRRIDYGSSGSGGIGGTASGFQGLGAGGGVRVCTGVGGGPSAGTGVNSAYSTGSTVGRYENFSDTSYEFPEKGLEPTEAGTPVHRNSGNENSKSGSYQHSSGAADGLDML